MIDQIQANTIARLNTYLASELGNTPTGAPMYQWASTKPTPYNLPNTLILTHVEKESDGEFYIETDQHCHCGVNVTVHKPECKLSVMLDKFHFADLMPGADPGFAFCCFRPCHNPTFPRWYKGSYFPLAALIDENGGTTFKPSFVVNLPKLPDDVMTRQLATSIKYMQSDAYINRKRETTAEDRQRETAEFLKEVGGVTGRWTGNDAPKHIKDMMDLFKSLVNQNEQVNVL